MSEGQKADLCIINNVLKKHSPGQNIQSHRDFLPLKTDNYSWTCICEPCFGPFNMVASHQSSPKTKSVTTETIMNYWPLSAAT